MTEESFELARKFEFWFAALLIGIMVVSMIILISRVDSARGLYIAERDHFADTTTGSISHSYFYTDRGSGYYKVEYRYNANNADHTSEVRVTEASYGKLGKLPEGSPVRVTYSRYDPTVSRLTDYSAASDYVNYMYALCTIEGACLLVLLLNRYQRVKAVDLLSD
jgi:uncharacterized membrane protein